MYMNEVYKNYKKKSPQHKYNKFYQLSGVVIFIIYIMLYFAFDLKKMDPLLLFMFSFFGSLLLAGFFIIIYIIIDIKKNKIKTCSGRGVRLKAKFIEYINYNEKIRISNLKEILENYNILSKTDIKETIAYFENRLPQNKQYDALGLITNISLTTASIVIIDGKTNHDLLNKLASLISICLLMVFSMKFFYKIMIGEFRTENKNTFLDDLYYIYFNYKKPAGRYKKTIKK